MAMAGAGAGVGVGGWGGGLRARAVSRLSSVGGRRGAGKNPHQLRGQVLGLGRLALCLPAAWPWPGERPPAAPGPEGAGAPWAWTGPVFFVFHNFLEKGQCAGHSRWRPRPWRLPGSPWPSSPARRPVWRAVVCSTDWRLSWNLDGFLVAFDAVEDLAVGGGQHQGGEFLDVQGQGQLGVLLGMDLEGNEALVDQAGHARVTEGGGFELGTPETVLGAEIDDQGPAFLRRLLCGPRCNPGATTHRPANVAPVKNANRRTVAPQRPGCPRQDKINTGRRPMASLHFADLSVPGPAHDHPF